jgi:hypothetical protein
MPGADPPHDGPTRPGKPLGDGTAPLPEPARKEKKPGMDDDEDRAREPGRDGPGAPLRCIACGAVFSSHGELQQHVRAGHQPDVS